MPGNAALAGKKRSRNAHAEMGAVTFRIGTGVARVVSAFVDDV